MTSRRPLLIQIILYADDTALLCKGKTVECIEAALTADLSRVSDWLFANKLTLNVSKTKTMLLGTRQRVRSRNLSIAMNGVVIENVSKFKYLGLMFDPCLDFNEHIDYMVKKLSKRVGILKRVSKFIDSYTLKTLYNAIIQPHIDYCLPVWSMTNERLINKVQVVQNRAVRVIVGVGIRDMHVQDMYDNLRIMTVKQRASYLTACCVYKCTQLLMPGYLCEHFRPSSNRHSARLSNGSTCLQVPRVKTETGRKAFSHSGPLLWNQLPNNIKNTTDLNRFKHVFKICTFNFVV